MVARIRWDVVFYELKKGQAPALDFLEMCPKVVRAELMATIGAVRDGPPPSFRGGLRWQAMHGDMGGTFEARDEHDKMLYRLFCILDRDGPANDLDRPSVVLLGGAKKPLDTEVSPAIYATIVAYRDNYLGSNPRPVLSATAMARALQALLKP
jgi:hypothetical protein